MERQVSLTLVADALSKVLTDAPESAREVLQTLPADLHPDAMDVLANVEHYLADADIRNSDEQYRKMQETQMHGLIATLLRGAPRDELLSFSFLSW
jgi:hypothetical protein